MNAPFDLPAFLIHHAARVEACLSDWVPAHAPAGLGEAMRYAVLDGGKRLRPLLALAAAHACGDGHGAAALRAGCAVEMIHAYSLVHDDMPCMDNDVLRRGKPTVHVAYGQAQALLAGDALQALAFECLLPTDGSMSLDMSARLCRELAVAAGHAGMCGGQAIDLAGVGQVLTQDELEAMHAHKTGALLLAAVRMGALAAHASDSQLQALTAYGKALGLAFQVIDDVLDVSADSATLGKTAGKDAAADKPTFVSLLGLEAARTYADALVAHCHGALKGATWHDAAALHALADWVVDRRY